jgi:hypothetical protein
MQTTPKSTYPNAVKLPSHESYPSSVPLYVYRELATELKATQAKLDAVTQQNQQLEQQNQLLRQEIAKVVQSFSHLQKLVDSHPQASHTPSNQGASQVKTPAKPSSPQPPVSRQRPPVVNETSHDSQFSVPVDMGYPIPETFFIEEQEVSYHRPRQKKVKEFSGFWLAVCIFLIMLSAFTAGYFIVRPLLQNESP